jgi:RNA polymerase sigma factor (sigma-70 family)
VRGAAARAAARARRRGLGPTIDVEDLQQEAHLILLRLMAGYDPSVGAPLPYFAIRLQARLNQLVLAQARRSLPFRRLEWDRPATQALVDALGPPDVSPEAAASGDDGRRQAALEQALARLNPRQRRLLFLVYWRDAADDVVARRLRISLAAARQARYRALRTLRARLSSTLEAGGPR